jgi:hypothetical protein
LPEKALLDTMHLRKAIPFRDELELDALDMKRLGKFAEAYAAPTRRMAAEVIALADREKGVKAL